MSTRGVIPLSWSLDHVGPLTRSVLDAAMLLQAIAGYDAQDATSVDRPVPALIAAIKRGPGSLRVGVPREYFFTGLQADVQTAVEQAIGVLSKLTAGVQDVVVPVSPGSEHAVMLAEGFAFHAARVREAPQLFQPAVLGRLRGGEAVGTATYIERRRELDQMRRAAPGLFAHVDLLVTPTVPLLPIPIAEAQDDQVPERPCLRATRDRSTPTGCPPCPFLAGSRRTVFQSACRLSGRPGERSPFFASLTHSNRRPTHGHDVRCCDASISHDNHGPTTRWSRRRWACRWSAAAHRLR